jgi:hypothetical protein
MLQEEGAEAVADAAALDRCGDLVGHLVQAGGAGLEDQRLLWHGVSASSGIAS